MPTPTKITRQIVLSRALTILNDHGVESLSMRELAKSLGVKAPSLYRYFPDKISLERASADYGNRLLLKLLIATCRGVDDDHLYLAAGNAYRRFSQARPHLYSLMMEKRLIMAPTGGAGKALWDFVLAIVQKVSGRLDGTAYAVSLWSFLHGFVSLEQAGRFGVSGPQDAFEVAIQALQVGFSEVSSMVKSRPRCL